MTQHRIAVKQQRILSCDKKLWPLNILDIFSTASVSLVIVEKKKPFALEMASCSQRVFWHKKQNFAKCEQGLREHVYASESIIKGRQADF